MKNQGDTAEAEDKDADDDMEYYRQEVGEEPDPGKEMFPSFVLCLFCLSLFSTKTNCFAGRRLIGDQNGLFVSFVSCIII